MYVFV